MNEELKIIIKAQTEQAKKNVKAAKDEVEKLGKEGKQSGEKFKKAMETMKNAAKTAGKAIGTALKAVGAAVVAAGAALVGLAESTAEYRQEQAKLTTAFEAAGKSADDAKSTYNDLYRVLGDSGQAVEAANHLALLTDNQKGLSEWTTICQGVYATFGDSLPIEGLTEAANETAKVGQVTGGLADALNWAGISEDEFNEKLAALNTEAEREQLIRETLLGTYDDAAKKYEENAKNILAANEAQARLTDSLAALGEVVTPVVTVLKNGLADVLEKIAPHLKTVSEGLQALFGGDTSGSTKLAEGISGIFSSIAQTITDIMPTLVTIGVSIVTSLVEGIIKGLPQIITAVVNAIPLLVQGLIEALPALISGIQQLITMLAQQLPAIMQIIVDTLPALITTITSALPQMIPELIKGVTNAIVILCASIDKIIMPIIKALPDVIISIIQALMENLPALINGAITLVMGIVEAIPQIIESLVDALPTIITLIIDGLLSNLPMIISGLINVVAGVVKALPRIFAALIKGVVNVLSGIWNGLENIFGKVGTWFSDKFKSAVNGIKNAFSGIGSFFAGIWNTIKAQFSEIGQKVGNAVSSAFSKAVNWVLEKAIKIINGFISGVNWAIDIINAIPGVNIKRLGLLDVPKLEQGGVLKKGQVGLLEGNGAEAVVPLEKNTGWLDKIAERLNGSIGGGVPIILQVDGKTFAQIACASINDLTRQTGSLPLVMG